MQVFEQTQISLGLLFLCEALPSKSLHCPKRQRQENILLMVDIGEVEIRGEGLLINSGGGKINTCPPFDQHRKEQFTSIYDQFGTIKQELDVKIKYVIVKYDALTFQFLNYFRQHAWLFSTTVSFLKHHHLQAYRHKSSLFQCQP